MRTIQSLLLTAAAIGLAGCSSVVSLHPFVPDEYATTDPALTGIWTDKDDTLYVIKADGKNYNIRVVEKSGSTSYSAQLYQYGDLRLLDLVSANEDPFQLRVHTPMRVWVDGATLRFATMNAAWLKEKAGKQLAMQEADGRTLITAPGEAVLRFLLTTGAVDEAYEKPGVLQRQQ
jgi:hypothetical protein